MIYFLWFEHKLRFLEVGSAQSLRFLLETNQRQSSLLLLGPRCIAK